MEPYVKRRACILVKAYPQPSQKYEETVCVAAVTEAHELLRLYPIRFRHLNPSQRFDRFDWIECEMVRAREDPRPESFRVREDTIRVIKRTTSMTPEEKVRLWKPAIAMSLSDLQETQRSEGRSLGIVRPDPGSIQFLHQPLLQAGEDAKETTQSVYAQQSLLEEPLRPLPVPEYVFKYRFESGGRRHEMQLHDWEVETAYHTYRRRYGDAALDKMVQFYQSEAPLKNLHLIMGTMHKRPWQFIIIGVLRTGADIERADAQAQLL